MSSSAVLLIIALVLIVFCVWCISSKGVNPDEQFAFDALKELDEKIDRDDVEEITEALDPESVLMIKRPTLKENMSFFHPVNSRYWPYYFYSYPYQYKEGGAWPPNMTSRLYNWQPGYDTAGWSYWLRPGVSYTRWPRNRWVRQNGTFYYINNGCDRSGDNYRP